jgi:hypothetical protein
MTLSPYTGTREDLTRRLGSVPNPRRWAFALRNAFEVVLKILLSHRLLMRCVSLKRKEQTHG